MLLATDHRGQVLAADDVGARALHQRVRDEVRTRFELPPSDPRMLIALSKHGAWSEAREAWLSELDRRVAALG